MSVAVTIVVVAAFVAGHYVIARSSYGLVARMADAAQDRGV